MTFRATRWTFFWDLDDATRAWTKRFLARNGGKPPSMIHAGTYGATLHYLKAVAAAGTTDATKVVAKMKDLPIDDFYTKGTKAVISAEDRTGEKGILACI